MLKVNNSVEKLESHAITKGKNTHIKAQPKVTYEIVDESGASPKRIFTKRVGNDLQIMLEDSTNPDITIDGYYDNANSCAALIGQGTDGQYYGYAINANAGGAANLGGEALSSAFCVAESGGSWFNGLSNGVLGTLGLLGLGAIGGALQRHLGVAVQHRLQLQQGNHKVNLIPKLALSVAQARHRVARLRQPCQIMP